MLREAAANVWLSGVWEQLAESRVSVEGTRKLQKSSGTKSEMPTVTGAWSNGFTLCGKGQHFKVVPGHGLGVSMGAEGQERSDFIHVDHLLPSLVPSSPPRTGTTGRRRAPADFPKSTPVLVQSRHFGKHLQSARTDVSKRASLVTSSNRAKE